MGDTTITPLGRWAAAHHSAECLAHARRVECTINLLLNMAVCQAVFSVAAVFIMYMYQPPMATLYARLGSMLLQMLAWVAFGFTGRRLRQSAQQRFSLQQHAHNTDAWAWPPAQVFAGERWLMPLNFSLSLVSGGWVLWLAWGTICR